MPKIGIVKSNFNKDITTKMILAIDELDIDYDLFEVSGAFELPYGLKKNIKKYDCLVAVGCLIKGETKHFDIIADSIAREILNLSTTYDTPIGFGVITALNKKQAEERLELGQKATLAAINTFKSINGQNS